MVVTSSAKFFIYIVRSAFSQFLSAQRLIKLSVMAFIFYSLLYVMVGKSLRFEWGRKVRLGKIKYITRYFSFRSRYYYKGLNGAQWSLLWNSWNSLPNSYLDKTWHNASQWCESHFFGRFIGYFVVQILRHYFERKKYAYFLQPIQTLFVKLKTVFF